MMKMAMTEARRVPDRCKTRRRVGASLTPRKAMRGAGKPVAWRHCAKILRKTRKNAYQLWITR
jgi:hypothetical protein